MGALEKQFFDGLIKEQSFYMKNYVSVTTKKEKWIAVKEINNTLVVVILTNRKFEDIDLKETRDFLRDNFNIECVINTIVLVKDNEYINLTNEANKVVYNIVDKNIVYSNSPNEKFFQQYLQELGNEKEDKLTNLKKFSLTYFLLAINIIVFIITVIYSGNVYDIDTITLIKFGGRFNPLIDNGEVWRFITANFLHGGISHIVFNMIALNILGKNIEVVYGKVKYIVIYVVSSIGCTLLSYFLNPDVVSVGASGAIFGLLAGVLYFAIKEKDRIGKGFYREILNVIILNVILGMLMPNIDMYGHLGGFIAGGLTAIIIYKI